MKKVKKRLLSFKYKHPQLTLVLVFLILNVLILLCYSIAIAIIENINLFKALVYVVTVACMPDKLFGFDGGWDRSHFIQLTLMLLETIIFSGAIIGFVTNILSEFFERNAKAIGKIDFTNHMLFLNWSKIAPYIIYDLSYSEGKYDIIILSNTDRDEVLNSIESLFILNKRKMKNLNIVVKQGNPFSIKNLEDCNISKAKSITILTSEQKEGIDDFEGITDIGIYSLKLLMTVAPLVTEQTNIVVETDTEKCTEKINQLAKYAECLLHKKINVFSYDNVLGEIMGLILIHPLYANIIYELLSFEGSEFYSIPKQTIEDVLANYNNCIPVLNYDDDQNGTLDQVYVLAQDAINVFSNKYRREKPYQCNRTLNFRIEKSEIESHILILGSVKKAANIIQQIENYNKLNQTNIECTCVESKESIVPSVKKLAQYSGKKKLIITSNENTDDNSVDANIYLALLEIQSNKDLFKDIEIYTEILNPANYESTVNFDVNCVVISRKFISLMIVQLMTHPESLNFFNDLISINNSENKGAFDVSIYKASEVLKFEDKLTFSTKAELVNSIYYSSHKTKLLMGISKDNKNVEFLCHQIDELQDIIIDKDTTFILISC